MNLEKINIDKTIKANIIKLNNLGMKTVYSCSGIKEDHDYFVKYEQAYLCIKLDSISKRVIRFISIGVGNSEMWQVDLHSLFYAKRGEKTYPKDEIPVLSFRPAYIEENGNESVDDILRDRWEKLFNFLFYILKLEKENAFKLEHDLYGSPC